MTPLRLSVIVPTHNRPETLMQTVAGLRRQDVPPTDYEIIVVDDGSTPPVSLPDAPDGPRCRVLRREGGERSAARNAGAAAAEGAMLVFVDDDMLPGPDFLPAYLQVQNEWPGSIFVGATRLPDHPSAGPFLRFRTGIEQVDVPRQRGPVPARNFCAAGNMAVERSVFQQLGGFDAALVSGEDQDLALRHNALGGRSVFVPEATAIHCDRALDLRGYCRRFEWGSESVVAFCRRHPDWPDNIERHRVNGPVRWGREPWTRSVRKLTKSLLARQPALAALFALAAVVERQAPASGFLPRLYRLLLGLHIFRGYRRGWRCFGVVDP